MKTSSGALDRQRSLGSGERRDAIVRLRRAAEAAATAGQEFRGSELGMYASELEDMLNAAGAPADGAPLADAAEAQSSTGTGLASPEVIELIDVDADGASRASIDVEDDATLEPEPDPPSEQPARVTPPAPVLPPLSVPPVAAVLPAPRPVTVPPPAPPPRPPHPSSPPPRGSRALPLSSRRPRRW